MALGIPGAFVLLLELNRERASEYDLRMLKVYEKQLWLAGFGNYSDGKIVLSSESEGCVPAPGTVTLNFLREFDAMLSNAIDKADAIKIISKYNQHLQLAGFGSHYSADTIAKMLELSLREIIDKFFSKNTRSESVENLKLLANHRARTIRIGFLAAANLLSEMEMGLASDYDLMSLGEYEKRLKIAASTKKTIRRSIKRLKQWPSPDLGIITNNFLQDLAEEVASVTDLETKTLRLDEFDEKLRIAGYSGHYSAEKILVLIDGFEHDLRIASGEVPSPCVETESLHSRKVVVEASKEPTGNSGKGVNVSIVSPVEDNTASDVTSGLFLALRMLPVGVEASSDMSEEASRVVPVEAKASANKPGETSSKVPDEAKASNNMPDMTLKVMPVEVKASSEKPGEASSELSDEAKVSSDMPDKNSIVLLVEAKASSDQPGETSSVMPFKAKPSSDLPDDSTSVMTVEAKDSNVVPAVACKQAQGEASSDFSHESSNKVPDDGNVSVIDSNKVRDESASEFANENSSQATDQSSTWKLVRLDTPPPSVRPHMPHGSGEDPRVTYEAKLDEIKLEQTTRNDSEEEQLTDAAESLVMVEETSDVTAGEANYDVSDVIEGWTVITANNASEVVDEDVNEITEDDLSEESDDNTSVVTVRDARKVTGACLIEKADEDTYPNEPRGIDKDSKEAPFQPLFHYQAMTLEVIQEDVNEMEDHNSTKMASKDVLDRAVAAFPLDKPSDTDIERLNIRVSQNSSGVPVADTSKAAYGDTHGTLPICIHPNELHAPSPEDFKILHAPVTQRLQPGQTLSDVPDVSEVAVDPSLTQRSHATTSGVTIAQDVKEDAIKPTNALKKLEPPPQRRRRPRDPRATYAIKHSVPVEERYKVVARRRLPTPVDWFSSDLPPTPEFKHRYASLYTHLPLVIRTAGFSQRLSEINAQLVGAPSHMVILLRKQYDCVVAAFEKNLSKVRAERAAASKGAKSRGRQQPNQKEWRRSLIIWLVIKRDRYPPRFTYRPLDFSEPLTCRASAIAERMKWIDTRLANGNAQQALLLLEEFDKVVTSIHWRLDAPIPGEVPPDNTPTPLPPDLDELRRRKNRALKKYNYWPSPENKQILKELSSEFKRRMAIFRASEQ